MVLCQGESVLLGLADGLGGHPRGEIAAQLLIDVCDSLFRQAEKPIADPEHFMLHCIGRAHQAVLRFGRRQNPPIAPRSTAVLALIQSGIAYWVHVGDSRLYLIRNGTVVRRTRDHARMHFARQGARMLSRPRSSLTRCLGGVEEPPVTTCGTPTMLKAQDVMLLCSDGLWGQVPAASLHTAFVDTGESLADRLHALIETAAAHPHSDNVSAVALRWLAEGSAVVSPPPPSDKQLDLAVRQLHGVLRKHRKTHS